MKHLKYLFLFIGLAIFASCSESDVEGGVIGDANQASFSAIIGELQSRVTGNSWDKGDAIGIYALKADQALSDISIYDNKSNEKYITTGDGAFAPAGAPINFPETGNLDFVSYYPFQSAITDYKYNIDVTTQSDLATIDLLYSNNAKGESKENQKVDLKFEHMLSKLILNVELGDDIESLEGLTVSIKDIIVDGEFALADGTVAIGTTKKEITPDVAIAEDNQSASATAIVVPGQNLENVALVFSLGGKDFEWSPDAQELASSKKYTYKLKLTLDASGEPIVDAMEIGATISDWADGYIGDEYIDLIPEKEVGEFFTIAQLLAMYEEGGEDKWIIENPTQLKAVVTSDREGGNSTSPKNGYIQDEDGNGIGFRVNEDDHKFNLGDELTIDITGAEISKFGGAVQIGFSAENAKVTDTDVAVAPKEVTIEDILDGFYDATLVKIKDVQFEEYKDLAYYEGDKNTFDRVLVNINGVTVNVNTSIFAQFKDELLPKGKGDIVGIMATYFGNWQLALRNLDDVSEMSDDESTRFVAPTIATDIDYVILAKEAGEQVITVTSTVEWTATTNADWLSIDPASGENDGTVTLTTTANSAKEARVGEVTITAPNHEALSPVVVTITQKGTNDGTKEKPYTVAEAVALQGEKDVWVQGFIVGSFVNNRPVFSAEGATNSNLMLADNKDESDGSNVVPVQLINNQPARTDLNLVNNPDKYKVEVIIKGNLEAYFSTAGLKNAREYELATPGDTPDPAIFTIDKSAVVFNPDTELTSTVKLTTDVAQAWSVVSDAAWLTVAPASGTGSGDIVLTAEANTAEVARTANVTITPTANEDLTPIVVTVTQNGKPAAGGDVATDLFFSEYVEGSSNNKYLEIYNGTGATVDLTDYEVVLYSNGTTERGNNIQLTGTLAQGAVYVIGNSGGDIYTNSDVTSTVTYFNGDDAVALQKISSGDYVDIIGSIGERPDKKWSAGENLETLDKTLVRKPSIRGGVTVNPAEGFPTLATEWIGYPKDIAEYLGSHTTDY